MIFHRTDFFLLVALGFLLAKLALSVAPSPIAYTNIPFPVHPTTVAAGAAVAMTVDRCNSWPITIDYLVTWGMVSQGGLRIDLADSTPTAPPGCQDGDAVVQIPTGTPPGVYRIRRLATITALGNTYTVPSESVPLTVTP